MRGKIVVPVEIVDGSIGYNIYDYIEDCPRQIKMDLNASQFYLLKKHLIWKNINAIADTMIDDGEEEEITDMGKLENVRQYLLSFINESKESEVAKILEQILLLISEAQQRKTGLFFII